VSRERRKAPRLRRRLQVLYGEDELTTNGFGLDISTGGLFLTATTLLPQGTRIHMKITSPSFVFYAEGRVVRHKLVAPTLRGMDPQGMGIRFISPHEIVEKIAPAAKKGPVPFSVSCLTPGSLEDLVREQLARGVLIVPTGDQAPAVPSVVDFHVTLEFLPAPQTVSAKGRVIQLLNPDKEDIRAAVLEVAEAPALIAALRRTGA